MRYNAKYEKKNKPHFAVWIMRLTAVLGCLTIISVYMLSGMYAKFVTSAFGEDSARVARFEFNVLDNDNKEISLDVSSLNQPGTSLTYNFSVSGGASEVAQIYAVSVETTGNLPLTYSLVKDEKTVMTDSDSYTYTDAAETRFAPLDSVPHKYALTISWVPQSETDTEYANEKYADEIDYIKLTVRTEQED